MFYIKSLSTTTTLLLLLLLLLSFCFANIAFNDERNSGDDDGENENDNEYEYAPALPSTTTAEYEECHEFLIANMPARDIGNIPEVILNETITYALLARNQFAFTKAVPWDIFKNNVLPYAALSEARDNWRKYFFELLSPLVINGSFTNVTQVTLWFVNHQNKLFDLFFAENSTPWVYSPFEVITYGYASCTGYSLLVIAALRSIGIPVRSVGVPKWVSNCTHSEGNHNWIEIYDEYGHWSFTDAPGGYSSMNVTWFYPKDTNCQIPGALNYSIYASSFAPTDNQTYYVMEWDWEAMYVPAIDVTKNYQT